MFGLSEHALVRGPLILSAAILSGCATFNDVLVVDIGEQFRLIENGTAAQTVQLRDPSNNGFECSFTATSRRRSFLAHEKHVDGRRVRCQRLPTAQVE